MRSIPVLSKREAASGITERETSIETTTARQMVRPASRFQAAERLSDYKVPEVIHFRADPLPRNANGKIIKTELRKEYV